MAKYKVESPYENEKDEEIICDHVFVEDGAIIFTDEDENTVAVRNLAYKVTKVA